MLKAFVGLVDTSSIATGNRPSLISAPGRRKAETSIGLIELMPLLRAASITVRVSATLCTRLTASCTRLFRMSSVIRLKTYWHSLSDLPIRAPRIRTPGS